MSDNDHDDKNQTASERPPDVDAPKLVPVMEGYTEKEDKGKEKE